jgi:hypothetical protein
MAVVVHVGPASDTGGAIHICSNLGVVQRRALQWAVDAIHVLARTTNFMLQWSAAPYKAGARLRHKA